jgi:hypothetical protein
MIEKIVSGGQTGVDQAALAMAVKSGIPIGGWCPKGGLDADGVNIRLTYPRLREAKTTNPDERTKLNIENSDGTLIIVPRLPLPDSIVDGTRLTISYAVEKNKPKLVVALSNREESINQIFDWVQENDIKILNIGGPRESSWRGINRETSEFLEELFLSLQHQISCRL